MILYLTPEARMIDIPDNMRMWEIEEFLWKTGLTLKEKDGKLWATLDKHPRVRMADILAAFQDHPELVSKSYQLGSTNTVTVEDSDYKYMLEAIEK